MPRTTHDLVDAHAQTAELTETQRHRLLESARRRHVLAIVAGREEPIALEDLAALVAEREGGVDATDLATTLHHVHLPKMVNAGVLEYDPSANHVIP